VGGVLDERVAADGDRDERTMSRGARVALALALGALALALTDAFFNWVLFTDALVRRMFF
jgi:hypothetical protein